MIDWRKTRSAFEWGLFFGIVTWLLATAITNDISSAGVWGIIFSRIITGLAIVLIPWRTVWYIRGAVWGAAVNVLFYLLSLLPLSGFFTGWRIGMPLMLISGILIGVFLELALKHREKQLTAQETADK